MGNLKISTLCWDCKNTHHEKCSWFKDFTPVNGWVAKKTKIKHSPNRWDESYCVYECPNFEKLEELKSKDKKDTYKDLVKKKLNISERTYFRYKNAVLEQEKINSEMFLQFKKDYLDFLWER